MVFRDNVFNGVQSVTIARSAYCAQEQGVFWEYHEMLFSERTDYNDGTFKKDNLIAYAGEICYDSDASKDEPQVDRFDAGHVEAQGTPNFIVANGGISRVLGVQPISF